MESGYTTNFTTSFTTIQVACCDWFSIKVISVAVPVKVMLYNHNLTRQQVDKFIVFVALIVRMKNRRNYKIELF